MDWLHITVQFFPLFQLVSFQVFMLGLVTVPEPYIRTMKVLIVEVKLEFGFGDCCDGHHLSSSNDAEVHQGALFGCVVLCSVKNLYQAYTIQGPETDRCADLIYHRHITVIEGGICCVHLICSTTTIIIQGVSLVSFFGRPERLDGFIRG